MSDKKSILLTGAMIFISGLLVGMIIMFNFKDREYKQKVILQEEVNLLKEIVQERRGEYE